MGRYTSLYRLPSGLYTEGSPLIIQAGALLKDNQTGRLLAQIKFKSLSPAIIVAVKVALRTFGVSGEELAGVDEYQYLDFSASRGENFGDRRAIPLPDPVARSFSAAVTAVVFEDGSSWLAQEGAAWEPLPRAIPLAEALGSDELAEQYTLDTYESSAYAPIETRDLWICSCGAINKQSEELCSACGIERDLVFFAYDRGRLSENYDRRQLGSEEPASEQGGKKKKKKKAGKVILILALIAILAVGAYIGVTGYVLPTLSYNRAEEMLSLQDYDGAAELYSSLGNFKDSADKLLTAKYGAATELMNSGRLDEARAAFTALGDYSDAADMVTRCDYLAAEELLDEKDYDGAREAFLALGDYSDAATRADEALYDKAVALLDEGDSDSAKEIFDSLGDYSDSADQAAAIRQSEVEQVQRLIRQDKLDEAWTAYEKLDNYTPDALTADDFVVAGENLIEKLDTQDGGGQTYIFYRFEDNGYQSRSDVVETARSIHLGDSRLEVLMAYGVGDEESAFSSEKGLCPNLSEEYRPSMASECVKYIRYSFGDYRIYFYFDSADEVSWIFFTNLDYECAVS